MSQSAQEFALSKAKINLMATPDSAFYTTIAFSLLHQFDSSIPTAATNGSYIKYNPDFFMKLSPDERIFLMLHESMHCAYEHMSRGKNLDQRKYNRAADHVINLQLLERGFKMPKEGLADPQYKGLSTEEVYNLLPEASPNDPMPGFGEDLVESDKSSDVLATEVQNILVRAAIQSKINNDKPGTIPGDIQIFLDNLLNPKLPWYRILQKYLNTFSKNDYSFKKPNRRFFPRYHLPSLYGENLMDLAIAVDTSGSVSDADFKTFISETHGILRMMRPKKITLIQFDVAIKSTSEINSVNELMNVSFKGRGGTYIDPVIDWANIHKPQLLLVFTDGDFSPSAVSTKSKVIWLIHNNPKFKESFGKVIHYNI